jgi:hypothetical protein
MSRTVYDSISMLLLCLSAGTHIYVLEHMFMCWNTMSRTMFMCCYVHVLEFLWSNFMC